MSGILIPGECLCREPTLHWTRSPVGAKHLPTEYPQVGRHYRKCFAPTQLIDFALQEIIRREKAKGILALEGKIAWEGDLQELRKGRFADLG